MRKLSCRTVFISDTHLGSVHCQAGYLLDFLNSIETETVYLVGDIIDFQLLKKRMYWPASHAAVIEALCRLTQSGTRIVYIPGNHDHIARRLVGQQIAGIETRMKAVHVTAAGQRLLVSHGDEFDAVVRYGSRIRWLGDAFYKALLGGNRLVNRLRRLAGLPYWSLAGFIKSRVSSAGKYVRRFETAAARRARNEGFDGCVCGHIHVAALREIGNTLYINDGDWVEHCTAVTEGHDGKLQLIHWSEQRSILKLHSGQTASASTAKKRAA